MVYVIFNGRLGADAEVRQNKKGGQYVTFNVAVREYRDGEEKTSWIRIYCREGQFLNMAQYLKKGSFVSINGQEQVSTYVDKNGNTQISREVFAYDVRFAGSKSENGESNKTTVSTNTTTELTPSVVVNNTQVEMSCGTLQPQMAKTSAASVSVDYDDLPF